MCRWPSHVRRSWEPSWPCLCSAPGAEPVFPPGGAFPDSPRQVLIRRPCLGQAGARMEGIPGSGRAGDRSSRAGVTVESSSWALGSAQGEKSTPQTRTPPPKPIAGTQQGKHSQELGFPKPLAPSCPQIAAEAGSEPREGSAPLSTPPVSSIPPSPGTAGRPSLCPSPAAGCNKPLAPTHGSAAATALPVRPHAGNTKGATGVWGQSPKQPPLKAQGSVW